MTRFRPNPRCLLPIALLAALLCLPAAGRAAQQVPPHPPLAGLIAPAAIPHPTNVPTPAPAPPAAAAPDRSGLGWALVLIGVAGASLMMLLLQPLRRAVREGAAHRPAAPPGGKTPPPA